MTDKWQEDEAGAPVANAEDGTRTFDIYHVRNRRDLVLLVLFILALLGLLLYAIFSSGSPAV